MTVRTTNCTLAEAMSMIFAPCGACKAPSVGVQVIFHSETCECNPGRIGLMLMCRRGCMPAHLMVQENEQHLILAKMRLLGVLIPIPKNVRLPRAHAPSRSN